MEINKIEFKKWIIALRSGQYPQGTHFLQSFKGYCPLGVACRVLIPKKELTLTSDNRISGFLPSGQPAAPKWLVLINRDVMRKRTGLGGITGMNDRHGFTFNEIADILELLYIHKALE